MKSNPIIPSTHLLVIDHNLVILVPFPDLQTLCFFSGLMYVDEKNAIMRGENVLKATGGHRVTGLPTGAPTSETHAASVLHKCRGGQRHHDK